MSFRYSGAVALDASAKRTPAIHGKTPPRPSETRKRVKPVVALVDADPVAREDLRNMLEANGFVVRMHDTIDDLASRGSQQAACVVLDFHGQNLGVHALLEELARRCIDLPVVLATAHGDVRTAVEAMRRGAVDFIEKPVHPTKFLACVQSACEPDTRLQEFSAQAKARRLISLLTVREKEVLQLLASGLSNKAAAEQLGLSSRTIELYRSRIKTKFGTRSMSKVVAAAILAA